MERNKDKTIEQLKAITEQWSEIKCYWENTATQALRDSKHLSCEDVYDNLLEQIAGYTTQDLNYLSKWNHNQYGKGNMIEAALEKELEWQKKVDAEWDAEEAAQKGKNEKKV